MLFNAYLRMSMAPAVLKLPVQASASNAAWVSDGRSYLNVASNSGKRWIGARETNKNKTKTLNFGHELCHRKNDPKTKEDFQRCTKGMRANIFLKPSHWLLPTLQGQRW